VLADRQDPETGGRPSLDRGDRVVGPCRQVDDHGIGAGHAIGAGQSLVQPTAPAIYDCPDPFEGIGQARLPDQIVGQDDDARPAHPAVHQLSRRSRRSGGRRRAP
jgi:hypothetical protein